MLDVGSGRGGPSRYLAEAFGCQVTGIELSPSFVEAATDLTERAGLSGAVRFRCGAEFLPFPDWSFDVLWTRHVAMNVADRAGMYRAAFRVLRGGGRFAVDDVVAGSGEPLHVPVPWSRVPETSVLVRPSAMRAPLERKGFEVVTWADRSEAALA